MNRSLAAAIAGYSEIVYPISGEPGEAETQARISDALSPNDVWHFDDGDTQGFLVVTPAYSALIIRGIQVTTEFSVRDVTRNLKTKLVGWVGRGKAHAGYAEGLGAVWSEVLPHLKRAPRPIYVGGHSLGGVTVTLAAGLFSFDACYTFGAPKPGNEEFWQNLLCPVYRFCHAWDIAPTWPPPFFGFRQGGERWQISRSGRLVQRRAYPWELSPLPIGPLRVLDHRVGEYARKLEGVEMGNPRQRRRRSRR